MADTAKAAAKRLIGSMGVHHPRFPAVRRTVAALAAVASAAALAAGCGGDDGGTSTDDVATGRVLDAVVAQAKVQTADCAYPGIAGAPESAHDTFLMPPGCDTPITVGDIDVHSLVAVRSNSKVDVSTLKIEGDGSPGYVRFSLTSPSGRVCEDGIGFAAEPC